MAVDSMLPSPSSISNPMSGFEGLPGKRRKKRTSIETNVRVILERNFNTVQIWLFMSNLKIYMDFIHAFSPFHPISGYQFSEISSKIWTLAWRNLTWSGRCHFLTRFKWTVRENRSLFFSLFLFGLSSESKAYLRRDPTPGRAAQHGEGGHPCLVLQPQAEGEAHQPLQQHHTPVAQPDLTCCDPQSLLLQPTHGTARKSVY